MEPLRITGESAVDDYPNLGEATRLADRLVETAAYHPARLQDGCVVLDPRW